MGYSKISFMRPTLVRMAMTAARFCSAPCMGSYRREATSRNMKSVRTSMLPFISSTEPVSATEAMPSFSTMPAEVTNTALVSSAEMVCFSTARILSDRPVR